MKDQMNYRKRRKVVFCEGSELARLRQKQGLTLKQLGEKVGLTHVSISKYETGRQNPREDSAMKIAEVLGVSFGMLFVEGPERLKGRKLRRRWWLESVESLKEDVEKYKREKGV